MGRKTQKSWSTKVDPNYRPKISIIAQPTTNRALVCPEIEKLIEELAIWQPDQLR